MKIESEIEKVSSFQHLEMLANQVVEGFISGMHKSPFHGFSAEFAEHKVYNPAKAPNISTGNYLLKPTAYTRNVLRRKLICAAILLLIILLRCIIRN
jgi:hypothetical protein